MEQLVRMFTHMSPVLFLLCGTDDDDKTAQFHLPLFRIFLTVCS